MAEEFFFKGPAQRGAGQLGRGLTGQCQVADDHTHPRPIERCGNAIVKSAFTGMYQQMKERIKTLQTLRIDGQPAEGGGRQNFIDETAATRIDPIRYADSRIKGGISRNLPASRRDIASSTPAGADIRPETVKIGRIGKDAANPDNGDCWRV